MGLTRPRAHQLQDIDYKQTARALTNSNITLSGGTPVVIDGVTLLVNDRILVTGQTDGSQNGIYYVTTLGSGSNGTWSRSLDANATGEISAGTVIMVTEGTTYADTQWKLTTDDPITVGTTALTFARNGTAAYGVFAVAGQNSIVADAVGDTLTLVAGTNIELTTNDGTDTLTITPSLTPAVTSLTASGNVTIAGNLTASGLAYPTSDGSSGQVLSTNGSGTLSFSSISGGASVSSDTTTNAERLIYVGSTTTGTLSAVTQDSGLTYNPSTGLLTSAGFSGSGASLTALNGSNISTGTVAAARVATLNQNTTGTAGGLSSAVTVSLTGDVTGSATFTSAGDTASISTTIASNSVALGTDTTGNYVATGAVSGVGLSGSSSSEGGTFTVTSNATSANTASTIVARDGSGNFSAGTITATSTSAQYADLAEKYTTDQEYPIGTVMKVSTHNNYETDAAMLNSIAIGVISFEPAYLMNSDSEGQAIGLKGRVPVRVVGAVKKGDAVYCSDNGTASAEFTGCCLVGIALESNTNIAEKLVECVLKI
jgi:hypothetical protein